MVAIVDDPLDQDLAELAILLGDITLASDAPREQTRSTRPPIPCALPSPPTTPRVAQRLYSFHTPTKSGLTSEWSEAATHTQGVSNGRPLLLTPKKTKPRRKNRAYAVFYGRVPGVYSDWSIVEPLVRGVSCALYQGYQSVPAAQAAFDYAHARLWTRVCNSRPGSPAAMSQPTAIPQLPNPTGYTEARNPLHGHDNAGASLDTKWYVVYAGISPGVYQSSLECSLNTVGLRGAVFDSVQGKCHAIHRYQSALARSEIRVLHPPYYS
ncbi:hypothetical protein DFH09DRAFT_1329921 [Mycena vulgaris]|nr:hypothetical protein DFH09DRAFT_1329921 [Mycena vulgaris]